MKKSLKMASVLLAVLVLSTAIVSSPVGAEIVMKTLVYEDFDYGSLFGNWQQTPTDGKAWYPAGKVWIAEGKDYTWPSFNGGTGWDGAWATTYGGGAADATIVSEAASTTYYRDIKDGKAGIVLGYPDAFSRKLAQPIDLTKDGKYRITVEYMTSYTGDNVPVMKVGLLLGHPESSMDTASFIGTMCNSENENSFSTAVTTEEKTSQGKAFLVDSVWNTFVAEIVIDADGVDTIQVKAYKSGDAIPTEWDTVHTEEIGTKQSIDSITLYASATADKQGTGRFHSILVEKEIDTEKDNIKVQSAKLYRADKNTEIADGDALTAANGLYAGIELKNNYSDSIKVCSILAVYKDNKLLDVKLVPEESLAVGVNTVFVGFDSNELDDNVDYTNAVVKALIWSNTESMSPMIDGLIMRSGATE